MKCMNCGSEFEQHFDFCPRCGALMQQQAPAHNPIIDRMLAMFKDNLFLVICILLSINCVLSLSYGGIPVINGLITAFLWVVFAQARKNIADHKYLRYVSGTVFANYVIGYVAFGCLLLGGFLLAVSFHFISRSPNLMNEFVYELSSLFGEMEEFSAQLIRSIFSVSSIFIFLIFIIIAGIVLVFNVLAIRSLHRFAKSVYQSIEQCAWMLDKVNTAKTWLFVLGVFSGLGAASSLLAADMTAVLADGSLAAAQILAGILIGKYLQPIESSAPMQ